MNSDEKIHIHKSWSDNDFWLYFIQEFYDGIKEKNILTVRDTKVDYFRDLGLERTEESCFTFRKGNNYNHVSRQYHPKDSFNFEQLSDEDLLNTFNKYKRFYSYDSDTYISIMASLCGCESVIVPEEGVTAEEWKQKNQHRKYGIAYGLEDIENCKNSDKLRKMLENDEKNQYISVNGMFDKIVDYFKKNG
jgi:hypothetical protein